MEEYTFDDIVEYMKQDEEWNISEEAKKRFLASMLGQLLFA